MFNSTLLSWPLKASPGPVPLRPSLSGILWVEQRGVGQAGGDKDIAFSCTQGQPCPPPTFSPSHSQLEIHVRPLFLFFLPISIQLFSTGRRARDNGELWKATLEIEQDRTGQGEDLGWMGSALRFSVVG